MSEALRHDDAPFAGAPSSARRHRGWVLALGLLWILLGALVAFVPLAGALALEILLGTVFTVGGVTQIAQAARCRGTRGTLLQGLGGLLAAGLGALLLLFPLEGVLTLTLVMAAFFLATGTIKTVAAVQRRGEAAWGWALVSGLLSVVVGLLLWSAGPGTAVWVLGWLVGAELIVTGISLLMLYAALGRA